MNIFVTGVAGFLGSHIAERMLADGHHVAGIDSLIGGDMDNVPSGVEFTKMDCHKLPHAPAIMQGVDVVYHCAALAYEGLSVFSPYTVTESIIGASTAVFSAAIKAGVRRIVHCSSMARYGSVVTPFREEFECKPQDPYGIAKLATEQMLRNLCEVHGVEFVISVPHNIIGPRQKYDDPFRNVAAIMMNRMLQGKQPIIYGDGTQKRCFSFVSDCVSCLVKMGLENGALGEVINIGPDEQPISINKLSRHVAVATNFMIMLEPIYMPGRPQEVKVALCSSEKARSLLGYETKTTLDQGLLIMADWMRHRGPRPFKYHLPIEIVSPKTPKTWTDRIF